MNIPKFSSGVADYAIEDVDHWECDATLVIGGARFYFQFPSGVHPTFEHAIIFLMVELKELSNLREEKLGIAKT